ncbi:MAG: zf-TFIIB domain-containing protein [Dehalococcoidia bacterium]|nr:zf-TFIIB domain-containing protein [Dehalococcoidia bacterium]
MNCPNCGAEMRERDRSGVKIDFCPECKGVWLDRGELDKIISIELDDDGEGVPAANAENYRDARRRDDDDDDDDRKRRYRDDDDYRKYGGEYKKKSKKSSFFESLTDMIGGGE